MASHLKNQLKNDSPDKEDTTPNNRMNSGAGSYTKSKFSRLLFIGFLIVFGMYLFRNANTESFTNVSNTISSMTVSSNSSLLDSMNEIMVEMGFTGLTHEDLQKLRDQGVTATYISNIRSMGYTDVTLDDAVRLAKENITTTYMAMMKELGYELTLDDFIELRRAGVTAHFTSNIHDEGFTDVTKEDLLSMRRVGVTPAVIRRVKRDRGDNVTMEDIIRYRISNQ